MNVTKQVIILVFILTNMTIQAGSQEEEDEHAAIRRFCQTDFEFNAKHGLNNGIWAYYQDGQTQGSGEFGTVKKIDLGNGKYWAVKSPKYYVYKDTFKAGEQIYDELVALTKFGNVENYPGLFEFIGCTYQQKRHESSYKYLIYIVTENLAYDLGKNRNKYLNSNYEITRINHYKKLFGDLMTFQKEDYAHLDIKPPNIMYDVNKRTLKFIDYGFMRKYDNKNEYMVGTIAYMTPVFLKGENTAISYQRDVYALLLSIAVIEYGEDYIQLDCIRPRNFTQDCFKKLLSKIYLGFHKVENPNDDSISVTGKMDLYFKVNPVNVECYTLSCIILQNLKYNDSDCKTAEEIWNGFDKVIEHLKKEDMILV